MKRQRLADAERILEDAIETKHWDEGWGPVNPGITPGNVDNLTVGIAEGTTDVTRIGRKIQVRNITVNGVVTGVPQSGAAPLADAMRFITVLDKQANGATAALSDVLESSTFNSFPAMKNLDRFEILDDRIVRVDITAWAGSTLQTISAVLPFKLSLDVDIPVIYSSTAGAQAELKSNQILFMYINRNAESTFAYQSRLLYKDA